MADSSLKTSESKPTIEFNADGTLKLPPTNKPSDVNSSKDVNKPVETKTPDVDAEKPRASADKVRTDLPSQGSLHDKHDHSELETGKDKEPVLKPVDPTLPSENSKSDSATVEHLVGSRLGQNLPSKSGGLTSEGLNPDFRFDERKVVAGQYVPEQVKVKDYSVHKGQLLSAISLALKESGADTQQQLKTLEKISLILSQFLES